MATHSMPIGSEPRMIEAAPVRALVRAFTEAWNAQDAAALEALFADDAELIDLAGRRHHGRAAVVVAHVEGVSGATASTRYRLRDVRLRWLAPGVAVSNATWQMSQRPAADGCHPATREGSLLLIAQGGSEGWQIIAAQYTENPLSVLSHAASAA